MRSVSKRWFAIGIGVVVLAGIAVFMAGTRRSTAQAEPLATAPAKAEAVTEIRRAPVDVTEHVPGTVIAMQHAELSPKVMGRIAAVYVREGDRVQAGQLLARLEGNDLAANVQQAQAGVANAEAAYQQAKTGLTMQRTQSTVAIQQAQAAVAAAQAQLAKAKQGPRPEQIRQADEQERRAKAAVEQAEANLALVKEGARTQHKLQADQAVLAAQGQQAQAEAAQATAKAHLTNIQADYDRMSALYKQDIVPKQRLDGIATQLESAKHAVAQAGAAVNQAKAGVEMAKAQASMVHEGARSQEVTAAAKGVEQARAAYEQAHQEALMAHQGGRWEDIKAVEEGVRQAEAGLRAAQAAQARDQVSEKDVARAAAGMQQAHAGLTGAQTMVGYTAIYAPFSGIITARKADPGNMAMPQMPILALDDDSVYQLVSQVPERLAARLTRGARVQVHLDALGAAMPATLAEVVPSADPASRTLTVKANLPRTAGVKSGLFGRLTITTGREMQLTVPTSAVVERNGLTGVYVVDDGAPKMVLVTLGKAANGRVQVLSGLLDGQRVVTVAASVRKEGAAE